MTESRPLALVTGASSGIGAVFARSLAARGYDLVLAARRRERLEQLAAELRAATGAAAEPLVADLSEDAGVRRVEERIAAAPNLEFLVNNAGFGVLGHFSEIDVAMHDRMHRVHVLAALRLTHAALRGMIARAKGSIVNVSSVAAFFQNPGSVTYAATKAWMNSFTEGVHLELKSRGSPLRVQALCPGFTYTEFHDTAGIDRSPIPKAWWMQAEDVVEASFRGLEQGKLFVIPGWRYRLLVALTRPLPRSLLHWGTIRSAVRMRKPLARTRG